MTPLYSDLPQSLPSFAGIRDNLFRDEAEAINSLLPLARLDEQGEKAVHVRTLSLAQGVRQAVSKNHFEAFLQSYGLGSEEGVALMALAEALLRIPDTNTQDVLIRDLLEEPRLASLANSDLAGECRQPCAAVYRQLDRGQRGPPLV